MALLRTVVTVEEEHLVFKMAAGLLVAAAVDRLFSATLSILLQPEAVAQVELCAAALALRTTAEGEEAFLAALLCAVVAALRHLAVRPIPELAAMASLAKDLPTIKAARYQAHTVEAVAEVTMEVHLAAVIVLMWEEVEAVLAMLVAPSQTVPLLAQQATKAARLAMAKPSPLARLIRITSTE